MSNSSASRPDICIAGLVYFEIHVPVDELPESGGVERFVDELPVSAGGALNTASVAHALDQNVLLAFPSGTGLTDAAVHRAVERIGLSTTTWRADEDPAISVIINRGDDRSFLSRADYDALADCPGLPDAKWIHIPGLREAELLHDQLAEARARDAKVSVTGSWNPDQLAKLDDETIDRPWDLLVLNAKEFREATGSHTIEPKRLTHAAPDVIVTKGPEGILADIDGHHIRTDVEPSPVTDTTGAGDAFCAGYLTACLDDAPPADALRFASRIAARTLSQRGGLVEEPTIFDDVEL